MSAHNLMSFIKRTSPNVYAADIFNCSRHGCQIGSKRGRDRPGPPGERGEQNRASISQPLFRLTEGTLCSNRDRLSGASGRNRHNRAML